MKKIVKVLGFLFIVLICFFSTSVNAQCGAGQTFNTYCPSQSDSNTVGFEFCPNSGEIAQSTITAGTIGSAFAGIPTALINLTVYEGTSGSATSGSIVFGPANGNISGNTITATAPDLCLIFVFSGTPGIFSCADGFDSATQVCSESIPGTTVSFIAPDDLCVDVGLQTGLTGGSPAGGTYSGNGVTDDGNGSSYSFNPSIAGAGTTTITYTNGGFASDDVNVIAIPTINFTAPANRCIDAGSVALNSATPSGGTYSGPGVTNTGPNYFFNPAFAGVGAHTITYTEPGVCGATATDTVEVLEACGCPVGQSSNFFCGGDSIETDLVVFEVCPSAGMASQATITAGTFTSGFGNSLTVYEGDSGSGTSGTVVFGPASGDLSNTVISGLGADKCLIFVSNSPTGVGCQDGFETALSVCGIDIAPSISFTALDDICFGESIQTSLTGGSPAGGVYSGNGVIDDGNGITYSFDPNTAGVGITTITYTQNGNSITDNVEVFALGNSGCFVSVSPKVYLQGALLNPNIGEENLMRDDLRSAGLIPTISPYADQISLNPNILTAMGGDAIVDWVFVELRNATTNTLIVDSQSALLQRDGNVVATDGVSLISFSQPSGDYYIVIKHQNHLGIMTNSTIALTAAASMIDFTDATNQITFGSNAQTTFGIPNGILAMWSGNANGDTVVQYSGTTPDTPNILSLVLNDSGNALNFPTFVVSGYNTNDVNMDGNAQYSGTNPDTPFILQNVLAHPGNFLNFSTFQIQEQLPEN